MPLIMIILLPLLLSLLSAHSAETGPTFRYGSPEKPYTLHRTTPRFNIDYYLNPKEVTGYSKRQLSRIDNNAEARYVVDLSDKCDLEVERKKRLVQEAQGWFSVDEDKMQQANEFEMKSCNRLDQLRIPRQNY
jgi:DnaJ family protein B protein 12